ncbi:hypothetical protein [Candidatus Albibeggiatoa sp. nov. NOAA]|uniref:tetratricopeptide repeat protein n=1 Tax=Candidatus Albibeggiatoa sp. nov. NOAA TaxID=3162724 RepID=UPI0032FF2492|nr:tetratricopeptide repeat protein [Thiotrichaceae bacterium]
MTGQKILSINGLEIKIVQFNTLINDIEQLKSDELVSKSSDLLTLLFLRDEIEQLLDSLFQQKQSAPELFSSVQQLKPLDEKLKSLGNRIAENIDLVEWRERVNVDETSWWWFFEPDLCRWNRYDWVWSILTTISLALAASFMINIYSAISMGGISSIFTTFSTILQGLGLAILGGGALSKVGQEKIQRVLSIFNIPPKFYAETIFAISFVLLSVIFLFHSWLDDYYLSQGRAFYKNGELSRAADAYERGLKINSDSDKFNGQLGKVYESLGDLDTASKYYMKSVEAGNYWDLNRLGRVLINKKESDQRMAEAYLVLGLQRVQHHILKLEDEGASIKKRLKHINMLYQIRKNIGWTLLNQGDYENSLDNLNFAIELEQRLFTELESISNASPIFPNEFGSNRPGAGMAYCLRARVYEQQLEEVVKVQNAWTECKKNAYPEFIHELKWLYTINKGFIACEVNSYHVVSGMEQDSPISCSKINMIE